MFHNINAKQIPLTSEENLRLIFETNGENLFSDKTLLNSPNFGPAYYLARKLLVDIDDRYLNAMKSALENRRSLVLALAKFLISKNIVSDTKDTDHLDNQVQRIRDAFQEVNVIYRERPKLAENACHGVLVAFLYFALFNQGRQLPAFTHWVSSNRIDHLASGTISQVPGYHSHLGRLNAVDASSLVSVFEGVLTSRHREIFISMAFLEETNETYKTIQKPSTR